MKGVIQFIIGLVVALIGAVTILYGDFLGESKIGIAAIIGIIGIGIIASSHMRLLKK